VRLTGRMRDWTATAESCDRSFATLCERLRGQALQAVLPELPLEEV